MTITDSLSTSSRPTGSGLDWNAAFSPSARRMSSSVIREILKITQSPEIISFAGGLPAPELFPVEEVRRAAGVVLDTYGPAALQYSTTEGHLPLRKWLAERAGITPDHVQIMTGSQQGLDLLGKMLIAEGDVVLIEAPTYLGALQSFNPYGPQYTEMATDEGGIDLDALEVQLERLKRAGTPAKMLYCVPNFQNPTGRTLSLERRRRLVELTARHGVIVLEDDPYGSLRFTGEPLPSLYELALGSCGGPEGSHVIYSGSFSKVLAPGLRDAWVQAATPMIQKLVQAKQGADLHTPTFNQMIISELVEEVMPAQIERVRALYGARAQTMTAQMKAHFPAGVSHTVPEGGMFLWVTLPGRVDTAALLIRAVERKVAFVPGAPFFALGGGQNTMRLSFSSANDEQIVRGIGALGGVITEALT
jgi:2-aminoadipate transaminase